MSMPERIIAELSVLGVGFLVLVGLLVLAVRLDDVQVDSAAQFNVARDRQQLRRVRTAAPRGRILDCRGRELAANRTVRSLALEIGAHYQRRGRDSTVEAISNAIVRVGAQLQLPLSPKVLSSSAISRHLQRRLALPYVFARDIDDDTLARFCEQVEGVEPGFVCVSEAVRTYPQNALAAHVIGVTGRDDAQGEAGDEKVNFSEMELFGRSGLESYYDSYLRGVSGERMLVVAALGYTVREEASVPPTPGPDLRLSLDLDLQRTVEAELAGLKGGCAVIDPSDGSVLALASSPSYDLNRYSRDFAALNTDPLHPLVNRASNGWYAPGSTFKPITAFAALSIGVSPDETHDCTGVFELPGMTLRCARRWGHGPLNMPNALKESCNPYFATIAQRVGTNVLFRTARQFGLGEKTGLDLPADAPGSVPDGLRGRGLNGRWWTGELSQMAIGQGQLLVSPLQMARVAGAIGTGYLVTPHLKAGVETERRRLPFSEQHFAVVREGMRRVVDGGTGKLAGEGVDADLILGKTGTAEVGPRSNRRKNVWFVAYAKKGRRQVAVAMVIENGASGATTTAPKVANVLKEALK